MFNSEPATVDSHPSAASGSAGAIVSSDGASVACGADVAGSSDEDLSPSSPPHDATTKEAPTATANNRLRVEYFRFTVSPSSHRFVQTARSKAENNKRKQ